MRKHCGKDAGDSRGDGCTMATPIIPMQVGDLLELKKPHPCGERKFRVLRIGSEVRISCVGCERDMLLDRVKLERAVRKHFPAEQTTT